LFCLLLLLIIVFIYILLFLLKYLEKGKKVSFLLVCLTVVGSRSYVFPSAMGNSKLHVVLCRKCLLVGWFYLWKWFVFRWKRFVWLKRRTRAWAMVSVWEKIIKAVWTRKRAGFGELRLILICGRRTTGRQSVH
jgi:hypothetical protein